MTHVAMESSGVYWKPVDSLLEEVFTCLLVNAAHIKQVPGGKTDMLACPWIPQLLEHGLLRGSFVPPPPIRELRELTRYRKVFIQERAREVNRIHKLLEDARLKLASVVSRLLGVSGRAMLDALLQGQTHPEALAGLARGKLRKKIPALREALGGRFRAHHAFLLRQLFAHPDSPDGAIAALSAQIEAVIVPYAGEVACLDTIDGVEQRTAETLIAEIGVDMGVFPSDRHLASRAALCPGNNESAGKHRSGKTRKGNRWLRTALIEAALAATRTKHGAFAARYRRLVRHRGHKKAVVAVAHAILRTVSHALTQRAPYRDPGPDYFERWHRERAIRRAVQALERQGYCVSLAPAA